MTEHMTPDIERDRADDPLVEVTRATSEFAAQTKAAVLKDEGIDAFVFPAERSWTGGLSIAPSAAGVPVWVRKGDLERATEALKQRVADSVDLDWDEVDVGAMDESTTSNSPVSGLKAIAGIGFVVAAVIVLLMMYVFGRSLVF